MTEAPLPPADWYPDPTARHQYRYWNGAVWTDFVANGGIQAVDPLADPRSTSAGSAFATESAAPSTRAERRRVAENVKQVFAGPSRGTGGAYPLVGADGYPNTEVAGEFARIEAIHKVLGRAPKRDEEIVVERIPAELRPEPKNRHDKNAVMVLIGGHHVGYLEKEVAAQYQARLLEVVGAGYAPTTNARVWAVARPDWENTRKLRHHANVRVSLNEPHLILPLNNPPRGSHSILPWGNALQVTGEENHLDVLSSYVTREGDGVAIGTMHVVQGGTARAPKEIIEIRIDERPVGTLSPGSSQHFVPTVRHLEGRGASAAAWLRVKGSAIAVQVTVQATKAHELPGDWFASVHTLPALR